MRFMYKLAYTVLLIGATGFVGSHLPERLLERGDARFRLGAFPRDARSQEAERLLCEKR